MLSGAVDKKIWNDSKSKGLKDLKKVLTEDQWKVSFQSRVGPGWLQPFTDKELEKFPSLGIKNLTVACPSFVSDNLETLEEINMEARETFMDNGGEEFNYAPCLNDDESWIEFLASIS